MIYGSSMASPMAATKYDVVVVGAGPAGSCAARFAAAGGCRTLLVEKRQEIGSPVRCGEGIARHFLEDCDIPYNRKWVAQEVKGAKIFSPNGTELRIDERYAGNEVGIVLERDAFDKDLAKLAAKAGSDIWIKATAVGLLKDDGRVRGVRVKRLEDEFNVEADCVWSVTRPLTALGTRRSTSVAAAATRRIIPNSIA